jgi:hypothetical protein
MSNILTNPLTGGYSYNPLLNEYTGDITPQNTTSGDAINILDKPIHVEFYANENFNEALRVKGSASISLDTSIGGSLNVSDSASIGENLTVTGYVACDRLISLSDIRIKSDVIDLGPVDLSGIRTCMYRTRTSQFPVYGVIAQELLGNPLTAHLVNKGNDGLLRVDYIQFIPLLIKENQQLRSKLNSLIAFMFAATSLYFMTEKVPKLYSRSI